MGGLSRKRKQPRIVKKSRKASQKKGLNEALLPKGIKQHWNSNLTVKENFAALGLSLKLQPRMLQSKEGSNIVNNATKQLNPEFFANSDLPEDEPVIERPVADLSKIFPEIKPLAECIVEPTAKKMKYDEE
jgi:hypothetical protein